ncbi:non-ribosomal peptide synthetase, partial [Paenibacillus glycinis]
GEKTFASFLQEVKACTLLAFEHQEYPFEELVGQLELPRDLSRHPLFDTMFILQNTERGGLELPGLRIAPYEQDHHAAKFDLTLQAAERENAIDLSMEYSTALFKAETIQRMAAHFRQLLEAAVNDPHRVIREMDLLSEAERQQILFDFNATTADYPQDSTIHGLFEAQAERTPDNIAVVFGEQQLTYRELNERADRLARVLHCQGVEADRVVAILVESSLEMAVGLLGILKAGGAYLPINADLPEERIRYMLEDSEAIWIVTQAKLAYKVNYGLPVTHIEDAVKMDGSEIEANAVSGRMKDILETSGTLAYVIYTSGTTGLPKGVLVEHRSIANSLQWRRASYRLNEHDVILQLLSFAFDGFLASFFNPLLSGARVILLPESETKDADAICQAIAEQKVTMLFSIPSLYQVIIEQLQAGDACSLRHVTLAGEVSPRRLVEESLAKYPQVVLANEYGPTENSVVSTAALRLSKEAELTIGKPISGVQAYIVDEYCRPVPIGVAGELLVGGIGLARGYLNRPELTAEKFIPNPFIPGKRVYRTGDLARWLPDGNIEYLGRIDYQVKVRGYRVELGEIEARLLQVESVKEAAVIAIENELGLNQLCAYLVVEEDFKINQFRAELAQKLPGYMIPAHFVQLVELPLTPNGKLDRKALPAPGGDVSTGILYAAPRNETEQVLTEIWKDILGVVQVGIHDNFFELGGDSLLIMRMVRQIHLRMNHDVTLSTVFAHLTIAQLAKQLMFSFRLKRRIEWNSQHHNKLFCLPPIIGYGVGYAEMAKVLKDVTGVIAFEFIEEEDRMEQYISMIARIQPEGPVCIAGYSAGGNLAFELVKALESHGREVSGLILIDSKLKDFHQSDESVWSKAEWDDYFSVHAYMASYREQIEHKHKQYKTYVDNLINEGRIRADIHSIQSDKIPLAPVQVQEDKSNAWGSMTTGIYRTYAGTGQHHNMLTEAYIEHNGGLIKQILCSLGLN